MGYTGRERTDAPTGETFSPVIVERWTLSSGHFTESDYRKATAAVNQLANDHGLTSREAAAVIAQSYGLEVRFW
jgi:hypothetical protein